MLNNCVSIQSGYYKGKEEELRFLLSSIGDNIEFNDNVWVCNKLKRSASEELKSVTLYFNNIPQDYMEITKYFCLTRIQDGKAINTVHINLQSLAMFYKLLIQKCDGVPLIQINKNTMFEFQKHLKGVDLAESTRYTMWIGISQFFKRMKGWKRCLQEILYIPILLKTRKNMMINTFLNLLQHNMIRFLN